MPTAEEYLKAEIGSLFSHYITQLAIAKAEIERLRLENQALKEPKDGDRSPASLPG